MNTKALLIGAAALALTTTANAGTTNLGSVTIQPQVDLVGSFGLSKVSELKFGVIVVNGDMSGKTITVNHTGTAYGDVTLLGGTLNDGTTNAAANPGTATVAPGVLKVTGDIPTLLATRPTINPGETNEVPGASVTLRFDGAGKTSPGTIDLVDNSGTDPVVCGTVSNIEYAPIITGGAEGTNYSYGGTLILSSAAAAGMHCVGTAQVTLVFNE